METPRTQILLCVPTQVPASIMRKMGRYVPAPGSKVVACEQCNQNCWLGNKQQESQAVCQQQKLPCMVVCMACAVKNGWQREPIRSLGGEDSKLEPYDGGGHDGN